MAMTVIGRLTTRSWGYRVQLDVFFDDVKAALTNFAKQYLLHYALNAPRWPASI